MKYLVLFLILLFSSSVEAQIIVHGNVSGNEGSIRFARVKVLGHSLGAETDQDGKFSFQISSPGVYSIVTSAFGYITDTLKLECIHPDSVILNIFLSSDNQELEEVTVTTSMREVSISDSPIAIDIVTPKLFEKNPSSGLFESIGMVNGVRPQLQCNVCNTGDIHINGMEGPYTLVMIDGMPIISALGSVYGLMGIPNSMIQQVEIQKGPASTLYGSEAVGGLINVITRKPDCGPKFTFDVYGTSYSEFNVETSAVYKLGKRLSGIASANHFNFSKKWDINNDNFTDVTLQQRSAIFNKFTWEHRSGKLSHLAMRYYYEDRWGGELQWNSTFRGGDSIYGESIYTNRVEVIGNSPMKILRQDFNLQYSYNWHRQNSAYGATSYNANQHIGFGQVIKHIQRKRQEILLGIALRYTFYDDNTIITQKGDSISPVNAPISTFLPGVFVQDELILNDRNKLLLGLRYDYNSAHGGIFSPRANWKWELRKNHIFRWGIGNGYRVVNLFSEDHAAYNGAREVVILNDLRPEQSWNGSMNYTGKKKLKKGGVIGADVNLFYTYFSNKIVADYFSDPNKVIFDNLDGYGINRGGGVQLHWSARIPLKLMIGATYTDLFLLERDSLDNLQRREQVQTPPLTSNFVVSYSIDPIRLRIDLSGNVYSPMLLPVLPNDYRPEYSPWFTIMNIQLLKNVGEHWEIYGGCKNFLNFIPKEDAIMRAFDPFDKEVNDPVNNPNGYTFDPGYNYAPIQKARLFFGLRLKI